AEDAAVNGPQALTPEAVESVLADFRAWLQRQPPAEAAEPAEEEIDLHTLLGQFLALKHEVNLQTRAVRAQQEQGADLLQNLSQALEQLQRAQASQQQAEQAAQEESLRPLLKTLVDLYDALALARQQLQKVQENILPALGEVEELPEV